MDGVGPAPPAVPERDFGALSLSDDALPPLAPRADDDELATNVWASAASFSSSTVATSGQRTSSTNASAPSTYAAIAAQAKEAVAAPRAADVSDLDPYAPSTPVRPTPSRLTIGATVTPSSKLELIDDSDSPTSPSSFQLFSSPPLPSTSTATTSPLPPPPPASSPKPKPKSSLAGASSATPSTSGGLFGGMFRSFSGAGIAEQASSRPRSPPTEERKQVEYNEKHQDPSPLAQPPATATATATNPISSLFRAKDSSRPASPAKSGEDQRAAAKGKAVEPEVAFDFNRFLEQMRLRSADPIAKYLRSCAPRSLGVASALTPIESRFLKEFSRKPPVSTPDQIRVINDFLDFIAGKMRGVDPWRSMVDGSAGERGEDEFDMAMEAMEKLVMNRLWHLCAPLPLAFVELAKLEIPQHLLARGGPQLAPWPHAADRRPRARPGPQPADPAVRLA